MCNNGRKVEFWGIMGYPYFLSWSDCSWVYSVKSVSARLTGSNKLHVNIIKDILNTGN